MTIGYDSGGGATFERLELTETADQVEVGVVERASSGPRTADYERGRTTITLASPLGDRPVIDARSGRRVRQTGPTPGDPACPRFNPPRGETYTRAEEELLIADNPAVDDYLRRHDDVYGGSTIEGGNQPYIVFGFTRDRARHEREIERRSRLRPSQIRTRTVAHTLGALSETARRIRADTAAGSGFLDGYGRAGFFIIDVAIEGQAVRVHVVTTRPDHAAVRTAPRATARSSTPASCETDSNAPHRSYKLVHRRGAAGAGGPRFRADAAGVRVRAARAGAHASREGARGAQGLRRRSASSSASAAIWPTCAS